MQAGRWRFGARSLFLTMRMCAVLTGFRQAEVEDLRPTLPRIPTALGDGTVPAGFFAAEHVSFTYKGAQSPSSAT